MRYTFKIAGSDIDVVVRLENKRSTQLVADEGKSNGVMPTWVYNDYDPKPVAAWVVNVYEPEFSANLPESADEQSIDMFAWQMVNASKSCYNGEAIDAILVEWPDGGTEGAPTPVERLREMVIENRLMNCFGDGMERDYAEAGRVDLGMNVNEMTREELERELDGEVQAEPPTPDKYELALGLCSFEEIMDWVNSDRFASDLDAMKTRIRALQAIVDWHGGAQ